jgi:hypothetical protein
MKIFNSYLVELYQPFREQSQWKVVVYRLEIFAGTLLVWKRTNPSVDTCKCLYKKDSFFARSAVCIRSILKLPQETFVSTFQCYTKRSKYFQIVSWKRKYTSNADTQQWIRKFNCQVYNILHRNFDHYTEINPMRRHAKHTIRLTTPS